MCGIILTENKIQQVLILVDDRQLVQLVFPDQIVAVRQRVTLMTDDQFVIRCHEFRNLGFRRHPGNPVIAAGDHAD